MKINKTNVARLLDKAKVAYQLVPYEVDENDLSATHVADQLGRECRAGIQDACPPRRQKRLLRLCHSRRRRGRSEKGRQSLRQQKL